jgi:hypothetical protein
MRRWLLLFAVAVSLVVAAPAMAQYCAIGGCDETSEAMDYFGQSWIVNGPPTPGQCPNTASHHHIVISEICVGDPDAGEFIELCNSTGHDLYLENVWITDDCNNNDNDYTNIVNNGPWSFPADDFIARFPAGYTLADNSCIVIAPDGNKFLSTYGFYPDFEIQSVSSATDMITIGATATSNLFNDDGEMIMVFCWKGTPGVSGPDLVCDIDYVIWGDRTSAVCKTGLCVDGPDANTASSCYLDDKVTTFQYLMNADNDADPMPHDPGYSAGRVSCKDAAEICTGGNSCAEGSVPIERVTWGGMKSLYR